MALKRVLRLLSPVSFDIASYLKPTYTRISAANEQLRSYVAQTRANQQNSEFKGMPASFPCVDRLKEKSSSLTGKKGMYGEDVGGFKLMNYARPFDFKHGGVLPEMQIAYEEWGARNEDGSNVVLLFTGLSASSHAKSHDDNPSPGWWERFIGPGAPLDTNKFNVICCNVIGGCYGSSGPSSISPVSGKPYGTTFPLVTVEDMVRSQFFLMDHLGIQQLHAVVGSSLGGMLSLAAAALFPERVGRLVSISACAQTLPTSIAMRFVQRRILMSDPNWHGGHYYGKAIPVTGMQHARELGMIAYRSGPEWEMRFGNKRAELGKTPDFCPDFLIETYLEHHGEKFALGYDANSFLYISKAMDLFNMGDGFDSVMQGLARVKCPALVLGVTTDILFPIQQQRDLVEMLKDSGNTKVTFYEINSIYGHDSFMIDLNNVGAAIKGHLEVECDF